MASKLLIIIRKINHLDAIHSSEKAKEEKKHRGDVDWQLNFQFGLVWTRATGELVLVKVASWQKNVPWNALNWVQH